MAGADNERILQARQVLDRLDWYPRRVRLQRVRIVHVPSFFDLPLLRRFDGYTAWNLILFRQPLADVPLGLLVHELTHVWQMQHHPLRMPLSYLRFGYTDNPNERQARSAAALAEEVSPRS